MPAVAAHAIRAQAYEETIGGRMAAVDGVERGGLGIEGHVAADGHQQFFAGPHVARIAEGVRTDAKLWMRLKNAERGAVFIAEQVFLINQLQPCVDVISFEEVELRFRRVAVEMERSVC